jgi:hypothetical protein
MRRIVRLVLLLAVLLFALVLVLCPKTAMAEDPVRIAADSHKLLLENDRVPELEVCRRPMEKRGVVVRSVFT